MDSDLTRSFEQAIQRKPGDLAKSSPSQDSTEWVGTGLCAEAQADGVPCYDAGRQCDVCGRSSAPTTLRPLER